MSEVRKKTAKTFEYKAEPMPELAAEAAEPELVVEQTGDTEVRTVRVRKLDQQIVWRVIDMLKSL
jgi:hypothetical protein